MWGVGMTHPFPDLHGQLHTDCNPAVFRHFPLKMDDFTSFVPWAEGVLFALGLKQCKPLDRVAAYGKAQQMLWLTNAVF